ncbi:dTMP kinase [Mycoplasmopsis cricetuli]|uniref:dTMP kinase n=1 Tax=Mycoplasmopsis cricetuli TaxID=171283 RepID=UPI00046FBE57|nr:dTMP kinase [Mycoplasmopsis cricetuli]
MFITFEGLDGSGKTTTINKLFTYLKNHFKLNKIVFTREPGGKELTEAEKIRKIILDSSSNLSAVAEAMLYSTSRRIHLERVIWPALKENNLVLCDRYIDSFYAYQGFARDLGLNYVKTLTELIIDNCIPDITIFFNITPLQAKNRRNQNQLLEDRIEKEKTDFHEKVYQGYWQLINQELERFIVIDATKNEEEVFQETLSKLLENSKFKEYLEKNVIS